MKNKYLIPITIIASTSGIAFALDKAITYSDINFDKISERQKTDISQSIYKIYENKDANDTEKIKLAFAKLVSKINMQIKNNENIDLTKDSKIRQKILLLEYMKGSIYSSLGKKFTLDLSKFKNYKNQYNQITKKDNNIIEPKKIEIKKTDNSYNYQNTTTPDNTQDIYGNSNNKTSNQTTDGTQNTTQISIPIQTTPKSPDTTTNAS